MADRQSVLQFLREFKSVVSRGRGLWIHPRASANPTILSLGMTGKEVKATVIGLEVSDYCDGPVPDLDMPGELWIFGTKVESMEIYIKLKLADIDGERIAKCISFHTAQSPLGYPFR